ncbi:helix-turn-helix domain-containing protein [Clostridium pasteurianum]|uniref:Putative transcriptional regulator n=1 Tax=Clostridium pasteurianum BC1 TaxID=86416 RepID=R4KED3_CLOPA|nr:helix-turn-helix transcriptional regulator [Clostridium pasteurianum]AGK97980.1 putative transcriptional regulator [Clostridium pasteurianum BC1]
MDANNNVKKIGNKIREIRKSKKLSIMDIKEITGLSKSTISEIENNNSNPTAETLQKLANALKVPVSDFFADKNEPPMDQASEEYYESEKGKYKSMLLKDGFEFKTPQEAMKFVLSQPAIMGFGGFDANKMSDEEIMDFANELLNQLKLLGYKYKK